MAVLLAFSGGLDTSFCVPYLRETLNQPIHTVTVNTGGVDAGEADAIERRAMELGAESHRTIDGRALLFTDLLRHLIAGNVLRGGVYPLCVGPERVVQASLLIGEARARNVTAIAHGSTGAGNDQIRFDVALKILADDLEIITPIRDKGLSRADTTAFLKERGFDVPAKTTEYSINAGLWGTTIGGKETLGTKDSIPEDAFPGTTAPEDAPDQAEEITITWEAGIPVALDGEPMDPVSLIETLAVRAGKHGIGRDIHVGDTILGIKGRVAFEAPAPTVLIAAHRELEKIVLTKWQRFQKDHLADFYGTILHEGQYFDPVMRDIEALLDSSQRTVTGTTRVRLYKGHVRVLGCESRYSMFDTSVASYGETNQLWSGEDARGFARISAVHALLADRARQVDS